MSPILQFAKHLQQAELLLHITTAQRRFNVQILGFPPLTRFKFPDSALLNDWQLSIYFYFCLLKLVLVVHMPGTTLQSEEQERILNRGQETMFKMPFQHHHHHHTEVTQYAAWELELKRINSFEVALWSIWFFSRNSLFSIFWPWYYRYCRENYSSLWKFNRIPALHPPD